jgi:nicotinamidase-related amidase
MLKLDPNKTALLVINMNNDLLAWDGVAPLIPGLRQLLQAARARGVSVVYSRLAFAPGGADSGATGKFWEPIGSGGVLTKGTEGAEICRELGPCPATRF